MNEEVTERIKVLYISKLFANSNVSWQKLRGCQCMILPTRPVFSSDF
jgi:hypothetical protein